MQIDVTLDSKGYLPDRFAKYSSELYKGVPTCSFPFSVSGLPTGTHTLALSFVDFDSIPVCGFAWIHWIAANIAVPAGSATLSLEADASSVGTFGMVQGKNSSASPLSGETDPLVTCRYNGPQPPDKDHVYTLHVYALDSRLDLAEGFWLNELLRQMEGHVIASARTSLPARV